MTVLQSNETQSTQISVLLDKMKMRINSKLHKEYFVMF